MGDNINACVNELTGQFQRHDGLLHLLRRTVGSVLHIHLGASQRNAQQ